jgi:hypothetical protein
VAELGQNGVHVPGFSARFDRHPRLRGIFTQQIIQVAEFRDGAARHHFAIAHFTERNLSGS